MARATDASTYRCKFWKDHLQHPGGDHVEVDLKAYYYPADETVFWELRLLLKMFYRDECDPKVCRWLKDYTPDLSVAWRLHGMTRDNVVKDGLRAAALHSNGRITDPKVRDDYTMSTVGVLDWLFTWAHSRRDPEDKAYCKQILLMFFQRGLPLDFDYAKSLAELVDHDAPDCHEYRENSDEPDCEHLGCAVGDYFGDLNRGMDLLIDAVT